MATVMTVTGPIAPSQLGVTYAHEHLLGGPPNWSHDQQDPDLTMLSAEAAVKELENFKLAGGQAIV
jgi:predicted metal-dependent phosphotriesterase family hydrolase